MTESVRVGVVAQDVHVALLMLDQDAVLLSKVAGLSLVAYL
jgi:hypothetical protein